MLLIFTFFKAGGSCKWVNDSQHLLLEYFDIIRDSPSHIYHSALPLSPSSSWLHICYGTELSQEIIVVKGLPVEWGVCSRTVTLPVDDSPWCLVCWKDIIAVGCYSGGIILLDKITGSQTDALSEHTGGVLCLTFSPDGASLVSGGSDDTIRLWDVQTGGVVKTFHGHTDRVRSVSIAADSTTIASGSEDGTIRLWDIQTGECCHILNQPGQVYYVRFPPNNSQCFISTSCGKVQQWDISDCQTNPKQDDSHVAISLDQIQVVLCQGAVAVVQHFDDRQLSSCCYIFPGGRLIAVAAGSFINIWDITCSDPHLVKTFVDHTNFISSLAFSPPSSLISSSYDKSVKFWQISDLLIGPIVTDPKSTPSPSAPIKSMALQAKDGITISGDSNGMVRVLDFITGHCKASFQTPARDHNCSDIQLIDGRVIYAWCEENNIHIWDSEKGKLQIELMEFENSIVDVRISGDSSKIFALQDATFERSLQAWSTLTGEHIGQVDFEHYPIKKSITVDGSRIWLCFSMGELQGWNFGIPDSSPVKLSNTLFPYLRGTKLWDIGQSRMKDVVTGKVVFQLAGRYGDPVRSHWDGQFLIACYTSGEVLILDFNHAPP